MNDIEKALTEQAQSEVADAGYAASISKVVDGRLVYDRERTAVRHLTRYSASRYLHAFIKRLDWEKDAACRAVFHAAIADLIECWGSSIVNGPVHLSDTDNLHDLMSRTLGAAHATVALDGQTRIVPDGELSAAEQADA